MGAPKNETLQNLGSSRVAVLAIPAWCATPPTVTICSRRNRGTRKIFHASLKIPATPGDLVLYYPKWIPGEHAPTAPSSISPA